MDLVYTRSDHPVGLLGRPITKEELVLLAELMSCDLVSQNEDTLELTSMLPRMRALKLLEALTPDHWWTRAWTFQENYRGGLAMHLLISHSSTLESQKCSYSSLFGSIPGELRINSVDFHMVTARFALAFVPTTDDEKKAKETVLRRAPKYTWLLQNMDVGGCNVAAKAMSHRIIEDIKDRNLDKHLDRLAVVANCCQYSTRLNGQKLKDKVHSVSLSMLSLFLLNGEIIHNGLHRRIEGMRGETVSSFLKARAFDAYYPPHTKNGLTFNKGCRFMNVEFTEQGIKTWRHLWELSEVIKTSDFSRKLPFVRDAPDNELSRHQRERLTQLAIELRRRGYAPIFSKIKGFLDHSQHSGSAQSLPTPSSKPWLQRWSTPLMKGRTFVSRISGALNKSLMPPPAFLYWR